MDSQSIEFWAVVVLNKSGDIVRPATSLLPSRQEAEDAGSAVFLPVEGERLALATTTIPLVLWDGNDTD